MCPPFWAAPSMALVAPHLAAPVVAAQGRTLLRRRPAGASPCRPPPFRAGAKCCVEVLYTAWGVGMVLWRCRLPPHVQLAPHRWPMRPLRTIRVCVGVRAACTTRVIPMAYRAEALDPVKL